MQDFNEDYKDLKQTAIIGGVLYVLGRILPNWMKDGLTLIFWVLLIFGAIALWRVGFYGGLWEILVPVGQIIWAFFKMIFWNLPGDLICYVFTGHGCTEFAALPK